MTLSFPHEIAYGAVAASFGRSNAISGEVSDEAASINSGLAVIYGRSSDIYGDACVLTARVLAALRRLLLLLPR